MTDEIKTRIVTSVRDLPAGVWDLHVGCGHPFKSAAFMTVLEDSFPARTFGYAMMMRGDRLAGLAALTEEPLDLTLLMPAWLSKVAAGVRKLMPRFLTLRLGMVGTFETAQRHWWFDPAVMTLDELADAVVEAARTVCKSASLVLVRDFTEGDDDDAALERKVLARGYVRLVNHPIAIVDLHGQSIDDHFNRLKRKSRQNVRKKLADGKAQGLRIERVDDFRPLIDECYPLYLQVHDKSTDFKRNPLPRSFFTQIAERMPGESSMLTMRDPAGKLLGFILTGTSATLSNPFLIGMDYAATQDTPAYYCLLWEELRYAAQRGCREVDLGLTSYFVKQTIGAEIKGMTMAARIAKPWLRPILQPLLPSLLSEKQPRRREKFRPDDPGRPRPAEEAA